MDGLGRLFNYRHLADGGWVRMDDQGEHTPDRAPTQEVAHAGRR